MSEYVVPGLGGAPTLIKETHDDGCWTCGCVLTFCLMIFVAGFLAGRI